MKVVKFHEASTGNDIVQVMPGTLFVTDSGECITTILGSCISVCIWDPISNIGGLNHFMLPGSLQDRSTDTNTYGQFAMTQLVEKMRDLGASIQHCEAKMFGGGCMFPNDQEIGTRNIAFTVDYLKKLDISVSSKDVGLSYSRRIRFYTNTGKVMVKRLRSLHNKLISKQELDYQKHLTALKPETANSPVIKMNDRSGEQ